MINKRTLAWGVSLMFVLVTAVSFHLYGVKKSEGVALKMEAGRIETLIKQGRTDEAKRRIAKLPAGQVKTDLEAQVSGKPVNPPDPVDWKEVRKQATNIAKEAVSTADGKKYQKGDALYDKAIKAQTDAKAANNLAAAEAAKKAANDALEAAKKAPNKPPKDLGDSEAVKKAKAAVKELQDKILGDGNLVKFIIQTLPGNANFSADKNGVQTNANYKELEALVKKYTDNVQGKAIDDGNAVEIEGFAKNISDDFDIIDYANKKTAIEALIEDDNSPVLNQDVINALDNIKISTLNSDTNSMVEFKPFKLLKITDFKDKTLSDVNTGTKLKDALHGITDKIDGGTKVFASIDDSDTDDIKEKFKNALDSLDKNTVSQQIIDALKVAVDSKYK